MSIEAISFKEFSRRLRATSLFQQFVSIEAALSLPVPYPATGGGCAALLLLRTEVKSPGKTAVFMPEGAVIARVNDVAIARFDNYAVADPFGDKIARDKPLGTFPHPAISSMSRGEFVRARESYFAAFPSFFAFCENADGNSRQVHSARVAHLVRGFATLAEPFLHEYLFSLSPSFSTVCRHAVALGKREGPLDNQGIEPEPRKSQTNNVMEQISKVIRDKR